MPGIARISALQLLGELILLSPQMSVELPYEIVRGL
jgi:hypothetical protein